MEPALPVAEQQIHALVAADDAPHSDGEPPSVTLTVRPDGLELTMPEAHFDAQAAEQYALHLERVLAALARRSGAGRPRPAAAQRRRRRARRRGVERDRRARPGALLPRAGRAGRATDTRRDRGHLARWRGDLRRARRGCRSARQAPAGRGHRRGLARRRVLPALRGEPRRPARLLQARGGGDPARPRLPGRPGPLHDRRRGSGGRPHLDGARLHGQRRLPGAVPGRPRRGPRRRRIRARQSQAGVRRPHPHLLHVRLDRRPEGRDGPLRLGAQPHLQHARRPAPSATTRAAPGSPRRATA